jgi:hypothetical protein
VTKVDPQALRATLLYCVRLLAASAEHQNAYITEHHWHHDELALDLDAVREAAIAHCELSADQIAAINRIDAQLDAMSGHEHAELWTDEGVATAAEWQTVRKLAQEALALLEGEDRLFEE